MTTSGIPINSSTNSLTGTSGTTLSSNSTTGSGQTDPLLDKNAFLKLMMVQLQHQDPLNPSDPSQYLGQLAQMTTLEQETNIASSAQQTAVNQSESTSLALLGRTVTYLDSQGNSQTGLVQKVDFSSTSGPTLTINGISGISPTAVNEVS